MHAASATAGCGDAIVGAERQFQPAAHGDAVNRGDNRLGAALDGLDNRMERRLLGRLRRVEFGDVGAAREGFARACQHNRLDGRIVLRALDPFDDTGSRREAEAVYGGIVQRDDGHAVMSCVVHCHLPASVR